LTSLKKVIKLEWLNETVKGCIFTMFIWLGKDCCTKYTSAKPREISSRLSGNISSLIYKYVAFLKDALAILAEGTLPSSVDGFVVTRLRTKVHSEKRKRLYLKYYLLITIYAGT